MGAPPPHGGAGRASRRTQRRHGWTGEVATPAPAPVPAARNPSFVGKNGPILLAASILPVHMCECLGLRVRFPRRNRGIRTADPSRGGGVRGLGSSYGPRGATGDSPRRSSDVTRETTRQPSEWGWCFPRVSLPRVGARPRERPTPTRLGDSYGIGIAPPFSGGEPQEETGGSNGCQAFDQGSDRGRAR